MTPKKKNTITAHCSICHRLNNRYTWQATLFFKKTNLIADCIVINQEILTTEKEALKDMNKVLRKFGVKMPPKYHKGLFRVE